MEGRKGEREKEQWKEEQIDVYGSTRSVRRQIVWSQHKRHQHQQTADVLKRWHMTGSRSPVRHIAQCACCERRRRRTTVDSLWNDSHLSTRHLVGTVRFNSSVT